MMPDKSLFKSLVSEPLMALKDITIVMGGWRVFNGRAVIVPLLVHVGGPNNGGNVFAAILFQGAMASTAASGSVMAFALKASAA